MSLLSSLILPVLEKQLIAQEPAVAQFILSQAKSIGAEIFAWAEEKIDKNNSQSSTVPQ